MDDLIEWFGETERQIADAEPVICDTEKLRELSSDHKVISSTYLLDLSWEMLKVLNNSFAEHNGDTSAEEQFFYCKIKHFNEVIVLQKNKICCWLICLLGQYLL